MNVDIISIIKSWIERHLLPEKGLFYIGGSDTLPPPLDKADEEKAIIAMENGDVVCIEKEKKLTYDIPYQARLIEAGSYDIGSYEFIKGFICGLHSGNYDITHVFVDNFYKIVSNKDPVMFGEFLDWLEAFSEKENIEFVISVTTDPDMVGEAIKKYMI